jgi:hypothetical protein
MLYLIVLTFIVVFILCAELSAKTLKAIGGTELYWLSLFLIFGPFLIAYVLLSKKYKRKFNIHEKRKLIILQVPILIYLGVILSFCLYVV